MHKVVLICMVVNNLKNGKKFINRADYLDKEYIQQRIVAEQSLPDIEAVFHEGACFANMEWDGDGLDFIEDRDYEKPLNIFSYFRLQFDQYVRQVLPTAKNQVVGFRYFREFN